MRFSPALIICALVCTACSASAHPDPTPQLAGGLPPIAGLDVLRGGSAVLDADAVVFAPLARANTSGSGSGLSLDAASAGQLSYALYRIPVPDGTLQVASADGDGELWLLAADYGKGRWTDPVQFASSTAQVDLGAITPASPAGYLYFAIVASPGQAGLLRRLHITYDAAASNGSTYYVSNSGNDGADGSQGTPWLTLQHAADTVEFGDTVIALPGTYTGFWLQTSGTAGHPITFEGTGATINVEGFHNLDGINLENYGSDGSIRYVTINGFTVTGMARTGIRAVGNDTDFAHYITITNCTLDNNATWGILTGHVDDLLVQGNTCSHSGTQHGIYLSNSGDRNVARGNTCFGNAGCGLQFNADASQGADGNMTDALVEDNVFYDNGSLGGSALNTDGLARAVIRNNLIYGNHAGGIVIYNFDGVNSHDNLVVNNTVIMAANGRWCVNINSGSTGNRLYNNIFYNYHPTHGIVTIDASSLNGFESDYNCVMDRFTTDDETNILTLAQWQAQYGFDMHSVMGTPDALFVDAAGGNYQLQGDSAALDIGLASIAPPLDIGGILRPQGGGVDMGCYELPLP